MDGSSSISHAPAPVGRRLRRVRTERDLPLPGDVAEFDTRVLHWFGPAGDRPVEILSILGREGERLHVRATRRRKSAT